MSERQATIVALDRPGGMGERRRIESWESVFAAAGWTTAVVSLRRDHRPRAAAPPAAGAVLARRAAPETLAWSWATARRRAIAASQPDAIVAVTLRAFHPGLTDLADVVVLDFVDRLSVSYRDRSRIPGDAARRALFAALARSTDRLERTAKHPAVVRVAAGRADAEDLGAEWVPNVVAVPSGRAHAPPADHDVLFFGNLAYPPNVAAVLRLAELWPAVQSRHPGATALVAGRHPVPLVADRARLLGWTLFPDFPDLDELCSRARLGVVPLQHAAGIQNKLLEAAARGLAQVVSPQAMAGVAPDFPAVVARTDDDFAAAVALLLDEPSERALLASRARAYVANHFTAAAWAPWVARLAEGGRETALA